MDTVVVKGGKFTFTLSGKELSRGLRPSSRVARNSEYLVECAGAVGVDGTLEGMDSLSRLDTSVITDGFPFPQIFVLTNHVLVCGLSKIYEYDGTDLNLVYTATTIGGGWSVVDFFDYLCLTNGKEVVVRDFASGTYALDTTLPKGSCLCNYNGQVLVGAPDTSAALATDITIVSEPLELSASVVGGVGWFIKEGTVNLTLSLLGSWT